MFCRKPLIDKDSLRAGCVYPLRWVGLSRGDMPWLISLGGDLECGLLGGSIAWRASVVTKLSHPASSAVANVHSSSLASNCSTVSLW